MGCWGITALESDDGLDALCFIRSNLPADGRLDLDKLIQSMKRDQWNSPPDAREGYSHTGPMALAEVILCFLDQDISGLDYEGKWAAKDNKFRDITSFSTSKASIRWLRNYLRNTLRYAKENAKFKSQHGEKWNGWFEQADWVAWQEHMAQLVERLDSLDAVPSDPLELLFPQEQEQGPIMGQN